MQQLTRKEALEQGYWQCMPKHDGSQCVDLITNLDDEDSIEWLTNDENPVMLMETTPDPQLSAEHGEDWYRITDIRLIP